jgi:hypothetical protein
MKTMVGGRQQTVCQFLKMEEIGLKPTVKSGKSDAMAVDNKENQKIVCDICAQACLFF